MPSSKRPASVNSCIGVLKAAFRIVCVFHLVFFVTPAAAFSDAALVDGFKRTVFGSEYAGAGWQSRIVKKFVGPAYVYVDDRSRLRRGREVKSFVRSLPRLIGGLQIGLVNAAAQANFRVFIVDRDNYRKVVAEEVYGRPSSNFAPGKCLVRVVAQRSGISRSDAVIVADEGDFLFHRCMVEEILQGLGPVNDDKSLSESVFNDRSRHAAFTGFDRHILNMLYDPRVRPGMSRRDVDALLPAVAADVRGRLRAAGRER